MRREPESPSCRPEELVLHHYGELAEADRARLEKHLQQCSACRRELARIDAALAAMPQESKDFPPEEVRAFNERVSHRLHRAHRPAKTAIGWALAAATAVVLLLTLHLTPTETQYPLPEMALENRHAAERMPDPELLLNMELLENLELLQALEDMEKSG